MIDISKSIIIIGAGISGLAAGCYGQINNYKTRIFEMDKKSGGLMTTWDRKGFKVDSCIHWLVGSSPGTPFYNIWQDLGMIQGKKILNMKELFQAENQNGEVFHLYTNIDLLEKHMKEISPQDAPIIEEFVQGIRQFKDFNMPIDKAPELYTMLDGIKIMFRMGKKLSFYQKWSKISIKEFVSQFNHPLIRSSLLNNWPSEMSMAFFLITLAEMHEKKDGYPIGGSSGLVSAIEKRYLDLGGKINHDSKVEKILVKNNKAVGIKLANGEEHTADYIISATDLHSTIFNLLDGKYVDKKLRENFETRQIYKPIIFISLGINRQFKEIPPIISGLMLYQETPFNIAGKEIDKLSVRIHNFDDTLAPPGKTLLTVPIESEFAFWEELRKDMSQYRKEKEKIADTVIAILDKRFPGLSSQIEMKDVATPYTFYRYTGNWQGGYQGWLPIPATANLRLKKQLPGLKNMYVISQWVQPSGGIPTGAMNGLHVVQLLCKNDKKKFVRT